MHSQFFAKNLDAYCSSETLVSIRAVRHVAEIET